MQFSVTELRTFKRCRRMWRYSSLSNDALRRRVSSSAMSLGTLIHQACESWIDNPNGNLADLLTAHADNTMEAAREQYKLDYGFPMSEEEFEPFYDALVMARAMCVNYQKHWGSPLPSGFTNVSSEQQLVVPVPNTHHTLTGKIDGLLVDRHGQFFILERKTYSQRPRPETLAVDEQFVKYVWMLNQMELPGRVVGIAYDGLWKRESPPTGSKLPDLFLRMTIIPTIHQVAEVERMLTMEVNDAYEAWDSESFYPNRRWEGCYDCRDFEKLCRAESNNEDTSAMIKQMFTRRQPSDTTIVQERN